MVERYIELVSGLESRIAESAEKGDKKDPGRLEIILSDIYRQLSENAREIERLSRKMEDGSATVGNEMKVERMIARAKGADGEAKISSREKDVIKQLIGGKTNREISVVLGIDEKTVKNHLWKIYRKMGVKSRSQLLHMACRQ